MYVQLAYMAKIRKEYVTNPEFDPTKVAKASSAAEGLCKWVLAMEIYDRVVKVVAPKKEKLAQAEATLAATMEQLKFKRAELKEIEDRLASLRETFQNMVDEKNKLEFQVRSAKVFFQQKLSCCRFKVYFAYDLIQQCIHNICYKAVATESCEQLAASVTLKIWLVLLLTKPCVLVIFISPYNDSQRRRKIT